jgi:hypothetical protein
MTSPLIDKALSSNIALSPYVEGTAGRIVHAFPGTDLPCLHNDLLLRILVYGDDLDSTGTEMVRIAYRALRTHDNKAEKQ